MSGITSLCFDTKNTEGIENSDLGSVGFLPQEGHVQDVGSHTDSHAGLFSFLLLHWSQVLSSALGRRSSSDVWMPDNLPPHLRSDPEGFR